MVSSEVFAVEGVLYVVYIRDMSMDKYIHTYHPIDVVAVSAQCVWYGSNAHALQSVYRRPHVYTYVYCVFHISPTVQALSAEVIKTIRDIVSLNPVYK